MKSKILSGRTLSYLPGVKPGVTANGGRSGWFTQWLIAALLLISTVGGSAAVTITRTSGTNTFYIDTSKTPHLNSGYVSYLVSNNDAVTYSNVWVKIDSFSGGALGLAANEDGEVNLGTLAPGATKPAFFYLTATGAVAAQQSHAIKVYDGYAAYGGTLLSSQTFTLRSVSETIAANANKVTAIVYGPEPPTLGGIVTVVVEGHTGTIGSAQRLSFTPASFGAWRADAYELVNTVVTLSGANTGSFTNILAIPVENITSTADTEYVATYKFRTVGVTTIPTQISPVGYISSGTQVKHTTTGNYGGMSPIQPATNAVTMTMLANTNQLFAAGTVTFILRLNNPGEYDVFLDKFRNTLPAGVSFVGGSCTFNGAGFGDPYVTGQELNWAGYFEVPAGTTRDFVFQASFPSTTGRYTNSAVAFTQIAQIDTTLDTLDDAPATQVIRVYGPNVAPVANNDSVSAAEDNAVLINVLANDVDENLDESSVDLDPSTPGQQTTITTAQGTWTVNSSGVVTFTAVSGFTGVATLSYTVSDTLEVVSGGATISVTVNGINDAPTLNAISNLSINEDSGLQIVNLSGISTGGEAGQTLAVTASSSNTSLVPNPLVSYTSPNATGSITFSPVANAFGTATITVVVTDNGGTANGGVNSVTNTFLVTVNPVNDVPSFTEGSDIRINKDATHSLSFVKWAINISEGPANETNQTVSFIVSNTNSSFFAAGGEPAINALGDLTFRIAGTVGTNTITVRVQDDGGTANGGTDASANQTFLIAVSNAGLIPATGGEAISATSAANAIPAGEWTTLIGPKYIEAAATNITTGTLVLHAPAGFEFDTVTAVTPPRVIVNIVGGGSSPAGQTINAVADGEFIEMTSVTSSNMTLTITQNSRRLNVNQHAFCSLTWTNVRVRPITGSPLVSGFMTNSGTSTQVSVTKGTTSWGTLGMVAGPAAGLQIIQQPSSTATAGSPFGQQPIVRIVDAAGNWLFNNNTSQVTVARFNGTGTLQGTTTLTAVNGEISYTDLNHLVAGTINLQFTSPGLPSVTSTDVTIGAAAAAQLTIATQPSATAAAGIAFAQQPVIRIEDAYGNLVNSTAPVTVARNSGSGTLQGTTTVNAVGGIATFSGLNHLVAGTINLQFTSPGLNSATSTNIVISAGAAAKLTILTQPSSTATAGTDFAQQPVIRIEDAYGNLVTGDNTTQISVARYYGDGTLQGTTTLTASGGIVSFTDLDHRVAGTINLVFTSNTGLTPATSSNITISAGAPAALAIDAQPSGRATVNVAFPDQPVIVIVDAYGNWVSTDNTTQVTVARSVGSGTLQGTTTLTASGGIVVYSGLYHPVNGTINLLFTSPGLNSVTSQNIVITPAISNIAFVTQPQNAVIGQNIGNVTVRLENGGVPVAAAGVPITIELASGTGLLGGTLTLLTDASGQVTFTDLSVDAVGAKLLEARSENLTALSDAFTIYGNPPTLTTMNTLAGATEDTAFTITYAMLAGAGNEADAEGDTISFLIGTVSSGTLTKDGVPVVPGVTLIGPGDELVWTPAANANGSGLTAFTVKAHDGSNASATPVDVKVDVNAVNDAPTLTTLNTLTGGSENTPYTITYASLVDEGDEADVDGDTVSFRVETISGGTLTKDGVPVVPGVTTLGPGEELIWTPAAGENGTLDAFTVKAYDGSLASATEVQVKVAVGGVNDAPTLTEITTLTGGIEDTGYTITYAAMDAAANENDIDGDTISFRIVSITTGTLTKGGVPVTAGVTLLSAGEELVWTPAADDYGSARQAFAVRAYDGTSVSTSDVQVEVDVTPVNDLPAFTKGINIAVNQDAGLQAYTGWATSISAGPANESAQIVSFIVSNNNNAIFSVQPSVTASGKLTFAPNGSSGTATVTVQIQDNGGTANGGQDTSGAQTFTIVFSEAGLSPATGGGSISADTAGVTWTALTGPVYEENTPADTGVGTFIINAPAGFEFDTSGTAPTVLITRERGTGPDAQNVNGVASGTAVALTAISSTQLTFTITSASSGDVECQLTWQNVRVRPTAGTPLASGNMVKSGTSATYQITDGVTSLGGLEMVPGAATAIDIALQPSATATAGEAFEQQPIVRIVDQFGNLISTDNTTVITVARKDGSGTLLGTTDVTVVGGVATFADLYHTVAGTITLEFTAAGLTAAESENVIISSAAATGLAISTQPSATAIAGESFLQQPVVRIIDTYGNTVSADNTTEITVVRNAGSGTLQGTTTVTVTGGVATFSDLFHTVAGTIDLQFTSSTALPSVTSDNILVGAAAAAAMEIATQPSPTAIAGVAFVQQPVVRIVDAFGNVLAGDNTTQISVARGAGAGALQGTTTATVSGGIATFSDLFHTVAGTIDLVFSSSTALPSVTSDNIVISPAAANRLAIQTQPSPTATAGVAFAQQPVIRIEDQYGNLISTDSTTEVTVAVFAGDGTLQGTLTATAVNGVVTFTDLHHLVTGDITLRFTSTGLNPVTSDTISISSGPAVGLAIAVEPSATATAGVGFAQQPVVHVVDAYGNVVTGDNTTEITVARGSGSGTLQGTTTVTVSGGVATFTDLFHTVAGIIDLSFTSSTSLPPVTSENIIISPAAAAGLAIAIQPSPTAIAGDDFPQQPVIRVVDAFGNHVTGDSTTEITVTRNDGSGTLQGTTTLTVSGGIATFTDLYHTVAGTIDLIFTSPGLASVTSDDILIGHGAAVGLAISTQPSPTATAGVAFIQQPIVRIVDAFGNTVTSDNSSEVAVARNAGSGTLEGTTTVVVSGGIATFTDLYHTVAGTIDLNFSSVGLASAVSDSIVISPPAVASQLGIATQPSPTALEGAVFGTQPVVRIEDAFGNLISGDNSTEVTANIVAGDGTLLGTKTVTAVNGLATFSDLSYTTSGNITLVFTSNPALTSVNSDVIAVTGVNDAPVFTLTTTDVQTFEDSGPQSFQLGDVIDAGAIDEAWQSLTITLTNDNPGIFLVQPQVSLAGVLTYTLNPDVSGVANVSITIVDNGGTANGGVDTTVVNFTITGLPINDQPTFFKSADIFLPTTTRTASLTNFALSMVPGPDDELSQTMTFSVTNDSAWAFVTQPTLSPEGTLTFEVKSSVSNVLATVTVLLIDDGGTANGGIDTSVPQTFRIALSSYYNYPRGNTFTNYAGPVGMWLGNLRGTSQWRDIITANSSNNTVTVRLWAGPGIFTAPTNYSVGPQPVAVRSGNLNGDLYEDIVTANFATNTISVLLSTGSGRFSTASEQVVGSTPNPGPNALTIKDANKDGFKDVFVANYNENTVTVLLGTGDGYFGLSRNFAVGAGPSSVLVVDLDADGFVDILTANRTAGTLSVLKGQGDGTFAAAETITLFAGGDPQPTYALTADFNGDNVLDIATANYNSNSVSILIGQPNGGYVLGTNYAVGANPRSLLVRDLNHDLVRDIVVVNSGEASLRVLLCNGDGTFEYGEILATGSNPMVVVGSNFNDDMTTDFVVANAGDGSLSLFRYTGPVSFNQWIDVNEDVAKTFSLSGRVTSYLGGTTNYIILENPTNGVAVLSGTGPNLTYTPNQDYFGADTIRFRAEYWIGDVLLKSGTSTVYFNVKPLNDAPSFNLSSVIVNVAEESALVTVPGFATDMNAGPANEADQSYSFVVTPSSATFFAVKPAISSGGTLTFQPALNAVGTVSVAVQLKDNGAVRFGNTNISAAKTFQVVVSPNPVKALKGIYNGLFYETNGVTHESSGFFTFNLASTRIFKGKMLVDGQALLFSNVFNNAGVASVVIPRVGKPAVTMQLALDIANATDQVTGTVTDGSWIAELLGDRQVYNGITNPAPYLGRYTVALPGVTNNSLQPAGDGYGIASVDVLGRVRLSGALGDGTTVAQGTAISKNGYWPFYASRYAGDGSVIGWLRFTNAATSSIQGNVHWIRPALSTRYYAGGFTNELTLIGSSYVAPTNAFPAINLTNGVITFRGGNLLTTLSNNVALDSSNVFTVTGTNGVTLKLNLLNGFITGGFTNPVTRRYTSLRSVALQQQDSVRGLFLGTNQTGAVLIENR